MSETQSKPTLRWRVAQFLERQWWQRYLRGKSPEEYLRNKKAYWQRTLEQLEWTPVPGRKVLDAGCGPAGVYIYLEKIESVSALDPLLDSYESELSIFDRNDYPGVRFLAQPLEQAFDGEGTFEAIYCFNAINHVSDWAAALDALTAHAQQGTQLLMTSDVHRHKLLLPIFQALPGDVLHPQQHGPEAYRMALQQRGWRIEKEEVLRREAIFDYTAWVATFK
ncbi:class I SAM-dependent methyltransferase [Neolewinella aurantiaca]|uniref:Class I SAM-dependent methyltransferase n=1 Tax=Neolewinella aurantiaca TaxID=2602767 RepID=A0A5C7FUP3_9BACT|nr:methyltransferase domain-containing protein [Neolewinella aurantiaca]TXF88554.1 class I SAM-dependent methyltransferase [Neolewinella aurantiaca]